jgi:long-chain acyl-CoA synthetase
VSRTLGGRFLDSLGRYPERTFLRHLVDGREQRTSYAEAATRTAATVRALGELGLRAGDRVVCYLDELQPSVYFCLAAAHAGLWPVPLAPSFTEGALRDLVAQVGAAAIFTTADRAAVAARAGVPVACFAEPGARAEGAALLPTASELPLVEAVALLRAAEAGHTGDDVYMLQPTSGTTGRFKLVMLPHRHQCYVADLLSFGIRHDDPSPHRLLLVAALTHGMGQIVFAVALTVGGELCVPSRLDTATSLDEIHALDPDYLTMTPRVLRSLDEQKRARGEARFFGPSAQLLLVGGAASDMPLLEAVAAEGVDVIESLGASEFGFAATGPRGAWRPGLVGRPAPDVKLKWDDDGELLVWSPEHMVGYYGDEAATRAAFTDDGYYRTGDYAELTADGYLRYLGRKKDVFNTHEGSNIHPVRIETQIDALPWVKQVVLIGDQRPYLAALIVVDDAAAAAAPQGFLDEEEHASAYGRAREALVAINRSAEPIERVRRFALFAQPMVADLYAVVGHSKVRRNRSAIAAAYAARIESLYRPPAGPAGVVPET